MCRSKGSRSFCARVVIYTMLYIRAKTQRDYLHIEGMPKAGQVYWYTRLTESARNNKAVKEEIIGWDNYYHREHHISL